MTQYLLNISLKTLKNKNIVKNNVEKIANKLSSIDIEKEKHKYLCLSCIFGAFLGDSMGSCCEFSEPSKDNHKAIFTYEDGIFAPGEVTDDSEMAMSAAFAYIDIINEKDPSLIQKLIYYYFCIWQISGTKDIGYATSTALSLWNKQSFEETEFNYYFVAQYNWNSLANGFLMRISTFIVYYYYTHLDSIYKIIENYFIEENKDITKEIKELYYDIYKESIKNTEITHPNFENGVSGAVFTLITLAGMVTNKAKNVYSLFKKITNSKDFFDCYKESKETLKIAQATQEKYKDIIIEIESGEIKSVIQSMGYYIHGFKLSIYFVKILADMEEKIVDDVYYKIMCKVCDFGGDTDTNCAIVGAMIGPLIGYKNFNKKYFDRFIHFIPKKRTQFNSAFMYVYVNYLEEKLLGKIDNNQVQNKENKTTMIIDNNEKEKVKEVKEEKKEELKDEENKDKKQEKKEEKNDGKLGELSSSFSNEDNKPNNKYKNFKFTSLKKIYEFLNQELNV